MHQSKLQLPRGGAGTLVYGGAGLVLTVSVAQHAEQGLENPEDQGRLSSQSEPGSLAPQPSAIPLYLLGLMRIFREWQVC